MFCAHSEYWYKMSAKASKGTSGMLMVMNDQKVVSAAKRMKKKVYVIQVVCTGLIYFGNYMKHRFH